MKRTRSLLVGVALLAIAPRARAEDARLVEGRDRHRALEFEACIAALDRPAPKTATALERAEGEVLAGVCAFELGQKDAATERFRRGLRVDMRAMLPPYTSPKIGEAFAAARADVERESPKPAPSALPVSADVDPSRGAGPPPQVEPARRGPPIVTYLLGGTALGLAGVGTYGYARARGLESDANGARFESDAIALGGQAKDTMTVANVGFIGALLCATAATVVYFAAER